jgi:hypothetical protein
MLQLTLNFIEASSRGCLVRLRSGLRQGHAVGRFKFEESKRGGEK